MSDTPPVRYRNTVLYDRGGQRTVGDVLLHADGRSSPSNGDEDVLEDIVALLCGLDHEHEAGGDLFLAVKVIEPRRAKS